MTNNAAIIKPAFELLARAPQYAGITINLNFSWRATVRECNGSFRLFVERLSLLGRCSTIPDLYETVASFNAVTLPAAGAKLAGWLDENCQGQLLTAERVHFYQDPFAQCALSRDRGRGAWRLWRWHARDWQLFSFAKQVFSDALALVEASTATESWQLCFYVNDIDPRETDPLFSACYVAITPVDGLLNLEITDRICWPWKEPALRLSGLTSEQAQQAIAGYLDDAHGLDVHSWMVSFSHQARFIHAVRS